MADGQAQAPAHDSAATVPDAVMRIQAIIDAEKAPQQPPPALKQAKEQEPVQQEAKPEEEAPVEPNKQVEGDDAPKEDAPKGEEIPLDQLEAIELEVVVKGEDGKDIQEKASIKDLREGYMRQKDYSRKTAELARQREQVREETRKAAEAERLKYVTELQSMSELVAQTAQAELGNVNMDELAETNAFEYIRLENKRKKFNQTLESIRAKQQEVLSKHQAEQRAAMQEAAAKARVQLEADIPGWNDAMYSQLMKAGIEKYGYKQEEVATWVDPRAFKLLHKAHLYDQGQVNKSVPPAEKKVVAVPKVVRPGAQQNVNQAAQREAASMKQLQTSGKLEDAAAVLRSRMR